ncbi:hypothetical protein [Natrinema halophilum]|uniref:Uncharacterized protein n=1 Tax=Natrinema halophilum TaxID=1699371 RepID=A0A7D5KZ75_9EURY|nr:hypothetical protein [Natrinema halophilum]QLG48700.1 hypothetical protein HYG82_07495 [Natrinema halophilum]
MTDGHQFTRVRLEEVLAEVETLDDQLPEPISLRASVENIETTIELLERVDSTCKVPQEQSR